MKQITLLSMLLMTAMLSAQTVFINEIHYDNSGSDVGEAIEIAGTAGTDVSGWSIVRYNGSNGTMYGQDNFSGTLADQDNGFGTASISYPTNGLQNGAPDGVALVNNSGTVVQFLSYEGTLTANDGPAAGMMSTDIGVSENGGTMIGQSLQLTGGPGSQASDFMWVANVADSFGSINAGQSFMASMVPCDISCPASINAQTDMGMMTAVVTYANPTLTGDCMGGFTQTAGLASGSAFPIGTTVNTFEATDANGGGTVTCSFSVTVSELIGPEVNCNDLDLELDDMGMASITASDVSDLELINGYALNQTGTFAPMDIAATGTNVTLGDDQLSGTLPIGFTFGFFGNDYTDFRISSNGFITFNTTGFNNGCCSGPALPNPGSANDLIAFAWEDLDPGNGGQPTENVIRFETVGMAPNRVLVMEFFNVDHFPNNNNVTSQVHLYEGSNRIEIHTTSMPSDGGNHTMGLENADGTLAVPVPGRNSSNWSATNDFVSFTPVTLTLDVDTFDCSTTGDQLVTVTATGDDGGVSSCTSTVNVIPNVQFTGCPIDIFVGTGNGVCSTVVNYSTPTGTSVCGAPIITQTAGLPSGSSFPVGETYVEFTADVNGATALCSFTITVTDTAFPELDCPGDLVVGADDAGNYTIEDYTAATDNCTSVSNIVTTQDPAPGTVVTEGSVTTVTVTATDEAGNVTECIFDLSVDSTLGLDDVVLSNALRIYPNPTNADITISNTSNAIIDSIQVVDMNGRVLMTRNTAIGADTQVDFNQFASGVYFVNITAGNKQIVKRVVKQ